MKKLPGLLLLLCGAAALAQNNPAVNQADVARRQSELEKALGKLLPGDDVPGLYSGDDEDIGPQSVLIRRKHDWFRAMLDSQIFYTDNMHFAPDNERDAVVAVNTAEAALVSPSAISRFASVRGEAGYRHQFFNYLGGSDRDDFDFQASTIFGDAVAQTKHYQFRAGMDYTRLLGFEPLQRDDYEEFYSELVPRWSVQRNIRVCDRSLVSLAYLGSYHFTDEDDPLMAAPPFIVLPSLDSDRSERWEHSFLAAYTVVLPCKFVAQPYYRFQYTDLVNLSETLRLHTVGLGLGWIPCANFSLRGFVGYNWQDASLEIAEYEKLDAGAGLNVTLRF